MTPRKRHLAVCIICAALFSCGETTEEAVENGIDQLERQLELRHYKVPLTHMAASHNELATFSADGCSGGLSKRVHGIG